MSRFIGGISGFSTSTNSGEGGSGIFGVEQSTYFKRSQEGNWPVGNFATGGTRAIPGNGYAYHTFQVSDNSQPTGVFLMPTAVTASTVDILLVGGGGSGGNYPGGNSGGAGGGGGIVYWPGFAITKASNYTVAIGAGGAATSADARGTTGGTSTFTSAPGPFGTARGGGGGGDYADPDGTGLPGGSGGGGGGGPGSLGGGSGVTPTDAQPIGGTFTRYGNAGGTGPSPNSGASAGGGGAGAAGGTSTGTNNNDNAGGDGQPFPGFEYPLVSLPGVDRPFNPSPTSNHYGGGGGGCRYSPNTSAEGGLGGGGGNPAQAPSHGDGDGVDGLGGGGAGGQGGGGDGGNGVCIIRYQQ